MRGIIAVKDHLPLQTILKKQRGRDYETLIMHSHSIPSSMLNRVKQKKAANADSLY
jgi:hypothetical protein